MLKILPVMMKASTGKLVGIPGIGFFLNKKRD
jgi:hypothetical protein